MYSFTDHVVQGEVTIRKKRLPVLGWFEPWRVISSPAEADTQGWACIAALSCCQSCIHITQRIAIWSRWSPRLLCVHWGDILDLIYFYHIVLLALLSVLIGPENSYGRADWFKLPPCVVEFGSVQNSALDPRETIHNMGASLITIRVAIEECRHTECETP